MAKLVIFNKPFNTLCQFTDAENRSTLADFLTDKICRNCYPAGRLDYDSEGLVILTDDGRLQHQIAHPSAQKEKTYWAQIENVPDEKALRALRSGVTLNDGMTKPAKARLMSEPTIWTRNPAIRTRHSVPTRWLELTITEGRNRQVRKMTAAVGHPTLRLVRYQISSWNIDDLAPGEFRIETIHLPKAATKPVRKTRIFNTYKR